MSKYTLGLVSVSFRDKTPEEILKAVKAAGLTCVEWGSDVHAPCKDVAKLNSIADLQREYGISCCSYGTYFNVETDDPDLLQDYIAAAGILGTKVLRLWCGTKSGEEMTPYEKKRLYSRCRKLAEIAEENGVILCMECHRNTFTQRQEDTFALMEAVKSPVFRMYWQPFQWLDAKGSLEVARAVARYTEHIHVFNWSGSNRYPLRESVEEWQTYLTAFTGPRTLLLEFMPDDRIESLPREAEALKAIVGEN